MQGSESFEVFLKVCRLSKPSSRPITGRSNNRSFRFSPSSLCGEADSKRLAHGNYTTPRCFKFRMSFLVGALRLVRPVVARRKRHTGDVQG